MTGSFYGISFFILLIILIIITLKSISDKFLASISFSSASGEFSCSFIRVCFFVFSVRMPLLDCFHNLGRSAKTLVQYYVRHYLCLALGNLFGGVNESHLVAPSAGPWYVQNEPSFSPRPAFTRTGPKEGSAKVSKLLEICFCLQAFC